MVTVILLIKIQFNKSIKLKLKKFRLCRKIKILKEINLMIIVFHQFKKILENPRVEHLVYSVMLNLVVD